MISVAPPDAPKERFYPLDALRGLAIGLMIAVNLAGNDALPPTFAHSDWNGLTLADTVFPGFLVALGTAMPYATRTGWRQAFGRAFKLFLVGAALVSFRYRLTFDLRVGVLQLIGMAYLMTWLIMRLPRRAQTPVALSLGVAIVAAYLWLPIPPLGAGSFEPDTNVAQWFDSLLGFESAPENPHAWIEAVLTVYLGVMAGRISQSYRGWERVGRLAALGASSLVAGLVLSVVVPVNKFLWTPTFSLVTGGIALLVLTLVALLIPARSKGLVLRPFVVLGGHAIVAYALAETVLIRARDEGFWGDWEPIVAERFGDVAAGAAFPLGAVLVCFVLAWVMERLNIHVRL